MANAIDFFSKEERSYIKEAIEAAELNTSGEIRVHLVNHCHGDIMDCAAIMFKKLNMHKTEKRTGVLIYIAIKDKKFAIIGDAGINEVTPENFWEEIKVNMQGFFKEDQFAEGLVSGIVMAGDALSKYFPCHSDDKNELPNEISYRDY